MLPSAAEMAGFDTLEIEVTQQCPNPNEIELGNCGAWDYLAGLFLQDDENNPIELARFITSYHRETHWVVDASPMLAVLKSGGAHKFRWSFAPSWNTQPTATKLSLRLSNHKKAQRPTQAVFLWEGGGFDSAYNAGRCQSTCRSRPTPRRSSSGRSSPVTAPPPASAPSSAITSTSSRSTARGTSKSSPERATTPAASPSSTTA